MSAASWTNRFACWTQLSEYDEKYAYSVKVSSGVISAGICSSRQSSHTRRCNGNVGSGESSSSAVRNVSHGGVAPRSSTLSRRFESHSRQVTLSPFVHLANAESLRHTHPCHLSPSADVGYSPFATEPTMSGRQVLPARRTAYRGFRCCDNCVSVQLIRLSHHRNCTTVEQPRDLSLVIVYMLISLGSPGHHHWK